MALAAGLHATAQTGGRTVWSGIYSDAQAARGKAQYRDHCSYCHHDDLLGGEDLEVIPPALVGAAFQEQFGGKTVGEMFRRVASTMPWRMTPLKPQQYGDIISYVLKENGFPAGQHELPSDPAALDDILVTKGR